MLTTISTAINNLSSRTDAFFSEDHLKLEFAFELNRLLNSKTVKFDIIPEFSYVGKNAIGKDVRMIFDLMIIEKGSEEKTAIEFKYKTKNQNGLKALHEYDYAAKSQAALNLGRFDCWCDIERLEYEKERNLIKEGYFIFITNDPAYWQANGMKSGSMQKGSLSLESGPHNHDDKILPSTASINSWTKKRLERNLRFSNDKSGICIKGDYGFEYVDFGKARFKSLLVAVK